MKTCHFCLFTRFLATALRKAKQWASIPVLAAPHLARAASYEAELELLGECRCGKPAHKEFERGRGIKP